MIRGEGGVSQEGLKDDKERGREREVERERGEGVK
jgi:hypothetical protein